MAVSLLLGFWQTVVKMIATARALQVRSCSQKSTISHHRAYATYAIVILINAHARLDHISNYLFPEK